MGLQPTEFPKLQEAENNLKPYQDLWFLVRDVTDKIEGVRKLKSVFLLDPEEIEKDIKQMIQTGNKLKVMFSR